MWMKDLSPHCTLHFYAVQPLFGQPLRDMFDKEFMEAFTFLKVYHYFADGDGKSVWTNHVK